jgi:hypothetical protein
MSYRTLSYEEIAGEFGYDPEANERARKIRLERQGEYSTETSRGPLAEASQIMREAVRSLDGYLA